MRICPQCGWPKEVHKKLGPSTRLPGVPAPQTRVCSLVTVDLVGEDEDIPLRRADVDTYRMRLAAFAEERSLA